MEQNTAEKLLLQKCFGQILRKYRASVGISQEKLALDIGLDRTYISLLERGMRTPTLYTIFLLSERLNVSVVDMVAGVDELYFNKQ